MEILHEDNHIIIVNKTNNDIVQGDKTGDETLANQVKLYLKEKYSKPGDVFLGVVHRIDRPTSGIVIFAKTSKSLTRLNEMFQKGEIQKIYWAIVAKKPVVEQATLVHYLVRNEKQNKSYAHPKPTPGAKEAKLTYRLAGATDRYFLLEIQLHTGRHHQIRAQLSKMGMPIKGDLKYGFPRSNENGGIHLHARKVTFVHPVSNERIVVVAPTPPDVLWDCFADMQ